MLLGLALFLLLVVPEKYILSSLTQPESDTSSTQQFDVYLSASVIWVCHEAAAVCLAVVADADPRRCWINAWK